MRVNRWCTGAVFCSLLISGAVYPAILLADELPSLDFLEYLGSEENQVDNRWTSPVDLDIENYLVANQPQAQPQAQLSPELPDTREDDQHE